MEQQKNIQAPVSPPEQKAQAPSAIEKKKDYLNSLLNKESFRKSLATVAPKHLTAERIVKMVMIAASRQPKLYECAPVSLLKAVMTSAELGLDCTGTLGQGWLVPFFNGKTKQTEAQFIPGYQGLISLARRSGEIARIESRVVYQKDFFDVEYGLEQKLIHKPCLNGERGPIVCVYAIAELKDGSRQMELMTIDQIEGIRARSKAKDSGPWITDFDEMARKTVVRRICKYLPLTVELQKAIEADDNQFNDGTPDIDVGLMADETEKAAAKGTAGLKQRMAAKKVKNEAEDKTESQAEPQQPAVEQETEAETEPVINGDGNLWHCNNPKCKKPDFDKPVSSANGKNLCPSCLSADIEIVEEHIPVVE